MDDVYSNITSYKCTNNHTYEQPAVYFMTGCKHFVCERCVDRCYIDTYYNRVCKICSTSSRYMEMSNVVKSINEERISLKRKLEEKINELEGKTNECEEKKARIDLYEKSIEDHLKCLDCDLTESEQKLQLCETCHGVQFDNLDDAKKCAICSRCSIKKHIVNGHNTVDFFPIFRSLHYANHSIKIKENMEHFENSRTTYNNDSTDFVDVNEKIKQQMDMLTDMIRRSRTTMNQQSLNEKLNEFIEKSNAMTKTANNTLKKQIKEMGDQLELMKKWNEDHKDYADPTLTE